MVSVPQESTGAVLTWIYRAGSEPSEGLSGRRRRHLVVDLHHHRDLAVPQHRHRHSAVLINASQAFPAIEED